MNKTNTTKRLSDFTPEEFMEEYSKGASSSFTTTSLKAEFLARSRAVGGQSAPNQTRHPSLSDFQAVMPKLDRDGSNFRDWAGSFRIVAFEHWDVESDGPPDAPVYRAALLVGLPDITRQSKTTCPVPLKSGHFSNSTTFGSTMAERCPL